MSTIHHAIRAHAMLIREMGTNDPPCNSRSLALILEADGRRDACRGYGIEPALLSDSWLPRAREIVAACKADPNLRAGR